MRFHLANSAVSGGVRVKRALHVFPIRDRVGEMVGYNSK